MCTFAHGDPEMRSKNENMMRVQQQLYPFMAMNNHKISPIRIADFPMGMMNPFMMSTMDPSFFNNPENPQSFDMNANMLNTMNFNPMGNFSGKSPVGNLPNTKTNNDNYTT